MKRSDVVVLGVIIVVLLPFFIFPSVLNAYEELNASHAYILSFIKFAILATFGECLGLRLRTGVYNKKGFEIYQINLDESESDWKSAVKFDELPWISAREDDPLDPKNAVIFNVKSLPSNYLFDKEGKIMASNLHGRSLQLKLEQLFIK